jgi:hypothetical protein
MKRALAVVALAGLVAVLDAPHVWAGAGQAGDQATGKIRGPAVSATIVINPTHGSSNLGEASVRLQKGSLFTGALLFHLEAPPSGVGWVLGCDGTLGAENPGAGGWNVTTLTDARFVNNRIRSWMPAAVMAAVFGQLGIAFDDTTRIPVITDVDSATCTQVGSDWFLSFTAVIQFESLIK